MGKKNNIFIVFLVIMVCSFGYSAVTGRNQISKREDDYKIYLSIKDSIQNNQELDKAMKNIEYLESKYPITDTIYLDKASIYLIMEEDKKVEESMDKAFKLNPSLDKNINILLAYAETSYKNNNKEKAQEILDKIMDMEEIPNEYKGRVDSLVKKL